LGVLAGRLRLLIRRRVAITFAFKLARSRL